MELQNIAQTRYLEKWEFSYRILPGNPLRMIRKGHQKHPDMNDRPIVLRSTCQITVRLCFYGCSQKYFISANLAGVF